MDKSRRFGLPNIEDLTKTKRKSWHCQMKVGI